MILIIIIIGITPSEIIIKKLRVKNKEYVP